MIRSIPRRTMSDVSRIRGPRAAGRPLASGTSYAVERPELEGEGRRIVPARKPREWRYQTRPFFKRVRVPLVDVFNEAEEVLIVVDLGGFTRGEISLSMSPNHYILQATHGEEQFQEIINLPANVDVDRLQERLLNGVLEIVLPRRSEGHERTATRRRATRKR